MFSPDETAQHQIGVKNSQWRIPVQLQPVESGTRVISESGAPGDMTVTPNGVAKHTISGIFVSLFAQGVRVVLQLAAAVIFARLLQPSDYGSFNLVFSVTAFGLLFKDGFELAAVQRATLDDSEKNALFWLNCTLGVVISVLLCGSAPLMSVLFKLEILLPLTACLSLVPIISFAGNQHLSLLRREMKFGAISIIDQVSSLLSVITGIVAALLHYGVWSLVVLQLTLTTCTTIGAWVACKWRPRQINLRCHRELLNYGSRVVVSDIAGYVTRNVDNFLIGRICGIGQLGLYDRAYTIMLLPFQQIFAPIGRVAHSALSRVRNDVDGYKSHALHLCRFTAALGMGSSVFLLVESRPIVSVLLGSKWNGVVPVLQALMPSAIIDSATMCCYLVLLSLGETRHYQRIKIWGAVAAVISFLIGIHWGTVGVAAGFSTSRVLVFAMSWALTARCMEGFSALLRQSLLLPIAATAAAGAAALCAQMLIGETSVISLLASSTAFAVSFATVWMIVPSRRAEIFQVVRNYFKA